MSEVKLLEISLTVEDELVEPVSEVLARYVKGGVAIESTAVISPPENLEGQAIGPLRVFGYISMDERLEETRRGLEEALWYLGRIRPLPEPEYREIEEGDWAEAWKQHYHPIPIGKRMMIVPAWLETPDLQRISIRIDPGMAFGTGTHPTTQLCLELIETAFDQNDGLPQPVEVIDIGSGTAILSIAAVKSGATHALGIDIDPDAVRAAGENVRVNQVESKIELGLGSLEQVKNGDFSIQKARLVLANILAPICIQMLEDGLAEVVSPGGWLILSGILDIQASDVIAAALRAGLQHAETRQITDWVALRFTQTA